MAVTHGNPISEEAMATLSPWRGGDFNEERAVWEGKFSSSTSHECPTVHGVSSVEEEAASFRLLLLSRQRES